MTKCVVLVTLGAVAGFCVGFVVALCWAAYTGNLMMPAPVYEEKKEAIQLTFDVLVGFGTVFGGLAGLLAGSGSLRRGIACRLMIIVESRWFSITARAVLLLLLVAIVWGAWRLYQFQEGR